MCQILSFFLAKFFSLVKSLTLCNESGGNVFSFFCYVIINSLKNPNQRSTRRFFCMFKFLFLNYESVTTFTKENIFIFYELQRQDKLAFDPERVLVRETASAFCRFAL